MLNKSHGSGSGEMFPPTHQPESLRKENPGVAELTAASWVAALKTRKSESAGL